MTNRPPSLWSARRHALLLAFMFLFACTAAHGAWTARPKQDFVVNFPVEPHSVVLEGGKSYPVFWEKEGAIIVEIETTGGPRLIQTPTAYQGATLGSVRQSQFAPSQRLRLTVDKYFVIFRTLYSYPVVSRKGDSLILELPMESPVEQHAFPARYFELFLASGDGGDDPQDMAIADRDRLSLERLRAEHRCAHVPVAEKPEEFVCLIDSSVGKGTGFLMRDGDNVYVYTAFHVIDGMPDTRIRMMDGTELEPLALEVSNHRDIARLLVAGCPKALPGFRRAELGEKIRVYGDSQGRGRVTLLDGKVTGLSQGEIETSAEFTSGNSGSALVAVKDGMALGVASYVEMLVDEEDIAVRGTRFTKPRRVGEALSGSIEWIPADLDRLYSANRRFHDHERFLLESAFVLARLGESMQGVISDDGIENVSLRRWIKHRNERISRLQVEGFNNIQTEADLRAHMGAFVREFTEQHAFFRRLCAAREGQIRVLRSYPGTAFQQEQTNLLLAHYEALGYWNDVILETANHSARQLATDRL